MSNNPLLSIILSMIDKPVLDSRAQHVKLEAPIISQWVNFRPRNPLSFRRLHLTWRWHPASEFLLEFNPHHIRDVHVPTHRSGGIVETIHARLLAWGLPTLDERI